MEQGQEGPAGLHAAEVARRALEAALAGQDGGVESHGRDLATGGGVLGETLDALHGLVAARLAGGLAEDAALLDALRRAATGLANGYTAAMADGRETSLRAATATLAERQAELWALHRVNAAVNSTLDEEAILTTVVSTVAEVMRSDVCSIYLFQPPNSLILSATRGLDPRAVGYAHLFLGEGITGAAAREGVPIAVEDIWTDPRAKHLPETAEEQFHSMLSVPIIVYTVNNLNRLIGVLNIQTVARKRFSREEIAFAEMVCGELALAIENARSYQQTDAQLHQRVAELTTLRRVIALVASTLDLDRVLDSIADQAVELSAADAVAIFQLNGATSRLIPVATRGIAAELLPAGGLETTGALGRSVERATRLTVHDAQADEGHSNPESGLVPGFRSMFCVPFRGGRDTLGIICLYTHAQRVFSSDTVDLLAAFAAEAAVALENARLYEEAQRSLAAKSALLSEMHHRVKNNLQTVASLVRMGLRHVQAPEVAVILQESEARIQSIAAAHDLLSQEELGLTTVAQVVQKVVGISEIHFRDPAQPITFQIEGEAVPVDTQQATTLAIVLNELLNNAMRHAFAGRPSGTIRIRYGVQDGRARVSVADDGAGLPPSFTLETRKGLGLSIVETLTRHDLHGEIAVATDGGTAFTILFPLA